MSDETHNTAFAGMTKTKLESLRQEHGGLKALRVPLPDSSPIDVLIRKPTRLEYERYLDATSKVKAGNMGAATTAARNLVRTCVLAPDEATLTGLMDTYAALPDKLIEPALAMIGADIEVQEITF